MGMNSQLTSQTLYPQGKSPWYPLDRRLGGPQSRSGRGGEEKNSQPPPGIENPERPARSPTLYRLSYQGSNGYPELLLRGQSSRFVRLTTLLHLVPRLIMRGALPPFPQCVLMAWYLLTHRDRFIFTVYTFDINGTDQDRTWNHFNAEFVVQ
jgi:hypothetical protein